MSEDLTVEQVLHSVRVKDIVNTQNLVAIQICSYIQHLTWYEMSPCQINGLSTVRISDRPFFGKDPFDSIMVLWNGIMVWYYGMVLWYGIMVW